MGEKTPALLLFRKRNRSSVKTSELFSLPWKLSPSPYWQKGQGIVFHAAFPLLLWIQTYRQYNDNVFYLTKLTEYLPGSLKCF